MENKHKKYEKITHIDPEKRELAKTIVAQMTTEEKSLFHSGMGGWHTCPIDRLLIPAMHMTDGPHGLRKKIDVNARTSAENTVKATCFPAAVSASCSFDRELLYEMGVAMAEECIAEDIAVILGPAANIKRSPLCGRNFEYISEDPYVAGEYATAMINGIQSKNVGTSLKHFCANNQEFARLASSSVIDERTLREIYLAGFEAAIKKAQPFSVMCCYNKINGVYGASNKRLLTDILKGEWGFEGAVMTDWGAMDDRPESVKAGLDLEMPAPLDEFKSDIAEAVADGRLDEKLLDKCAERVLSYVLQTADNVSSPYDIQGHNELARRIARESAVLLKNSGTLPVSKSAQVAVIGKFAKAPRYQGGGSSNINPHFVNAPADEFSRNGIDFVYDDGYSGIELVQSEIDSAVATAKNADVILAFVGIPDEFESEGFDRKTIAIPDSHNALVSALVATGKPVVAIVMAGSAIDMPWRDKVSALLLMNIAGQNVGGAVYDLVFGDFSPCGKLTETFPLTLCDTPSYSYFGTGDNVDYAESIYVGYRYYDKAHMEVAYPFGFGLSYSEFEYKNIRLSATNIKDTDTLTVTVTVKNTGKMTAKEIVQLYVCPFESTLFKAVRELKEYQKIDLMPNEEKDVTFTLNKRAFAYYNVDIADWHVETGAYGIEIGASSRDIRQTASVQIQSTSNAKTPDYRNNAPAYYNLKNSSPLSVPHEQFEVLFGGNYPIAAPIYPFTKSSTTRQLKTRFWGRKIASKIEAQMLERISQTSPEMKYMLLGMMSDTPLRSTITLPRDIMHKDYMNGIVEYANGHIFKGKKLIKKAEAEIARLEAEENK